MRVSEIKIGVVNRDFTENVREKERGPMTEMS